MLTIALAMLMAAAAFVVPYHLAVPPTVSESYRCGLKNHTALLLFIGASLLFVVGIGGLSTASAAGDRRLPRWVLIAGVVTTLALCAIWRIDRVNKPLGSESHYQLKW